MTPGIGRDDASIGRDDASIGRDDASIGQDDPIMSAGRLHTERATCDYPRLPDGAGNCMVRTMPSPSFTKTS